MTITLKQYAADNEKNAKSIIKNLKSKGFQVCMTSEMTEEMIVEYTTRKGSSIAANGTKASTTENKAGEAIKKEKSTIVINEKKEPNKTQKKATHEKIEPEKKAEKQQPIEPEKKAEKPTGQYRFKNGKRIFIESKNDSTKSDSTKSDAAKIFNTKEINFFAILVILGFDAYSMAKIGILIYPDSEQNTTILFFAILGIATGWIFINSLLNSEGQEKTFWSVVFACIQFGLHSGAFGIFDDIKNISSFSGQIVIVTSLIAATISWGRNI